MCYEVYKGADRDGGRTGEAVVPFRRGKHAGRRSDQGGEERLNPCAGYGGVIRLFVRGREADQLSGRDAGAVKASRGERETEGRDEETL